MSLATLIGNMTEGICDIGEEDCCPHGRIGTSEQGSPDVFIEGTPVHRQGDGGGVLCPHGGYFISTAASATVFANGRGITRIGDGTTCINCGQPGSHVNGCATVFVGG